MKRHNHQYQVASTRHDFLPREYLERLAILQDDIPPEDFAYVKGVIEASLGKPIHEASESWMDGKRPRIHPPAH